MALDYKLRMGATCIPRLEFLHEVATERLRAPLHLPRNRLECKQFALHTPHGGHGQLIYTLDDCAGDGEGAGENEREGGRERDGVSAREREREREKESDDEMSAVSSSCGTASLPLAQPHIYPPHTKTLEYTGSLSPSFSHTYVHTRSRSRARARVRSRTTKNGQDMLDYVELTQKREIVLLEEERREKRTMGNDEMRSSSEDASRVSSPCV